MVSSLSIKELSIMNKNNLITHSNCLLLSLEGKGILMWFLFLKEATLDCLLIKAL